MYRTGFQRPCINEYLGLLAFKIGLFTQDVEQNDWGRRDPFLSLNTQAKRDLLSVLYKKNLMQQLAYVVGVRCCEGGIHCLYLLQLLGSLRRPCHKNSWIEGHVRRDWYRRY